MKDFELVFKELDFLSDLHLVGGCVRDKIIGRESDDIDLATSDLPKTIIEKAENRGFKTVPTGIDFGTVSLFIAGTEFEITTFRKELDTDGRHPDVKFTDNIEDDLARRDFTINAIALNSDFEFVDPFNGRDDIYSQFIKTVGDPKDRFREDYLRIIRGCRFASRYNFEVGSDTWEAMQDLSDQVYDSVSIERFYMELKKAFKDPDPSKFVSLMDQLNLNQVENVNRSALKEVSPSLRSVVYFLDVENINEKSDELKLPNILTRETSRIQDLIQFLEEKELNEYNKRLFQFESQGLFYDVEEIAEALDRVSEDRINFFFDPIDFPINPIIDGTDLIERGLDQGPEIGNKLEKAHEIQLRENVASKEELLNRVL